MSSDIIEEVAEIIAPFIGVDNMTFSAESIAQQIDQLYRKEYRERLTSRINYIDPRAKWVTDIIKQELQSDE